MATSRRPSQRRPDQEPTVASFGLYVTVPDDWDDWSEPEQPQKASFATQQSPHRLIEFCGVSGCHRAQSFSRDGRARQWCSTHHEAIQSVKDGRAEGCMNCKTLPKRLVGSDFCTNTCKNEMFEHAPKIVAVPRTDAAWIDVQSQFRSQWKHDQYPPTIRMIWRIYNTKDVTDDFFAYKKSVTRKVGIAGGNSRRRWHGTSRDCVLGDDGSEAGFCSSALCRLCSIIKTSFDVRKALTNTRRGRFGLGIYTSATSSKAHDYAHGDNSPFKAMILSEVIMGRTILLVNDFDTLTAPPGGFDSVVGEPGVDLNYDESVVYRNDAIRPLFLVVYEPNPLGKQ